MNLLEITRRVLDQWKERKLNGTNRNYFDQLTELDVEFINGIRIATNENDVYDGITIAAFHENFHGFGCNKVCYVSSMNMCMATHEGSERLMNQILHLFDSLYHEYTTQKTNILNRMSLDRLNQQHAEIFGMPILPNNALPPGSMYMFSNNQFVPFQVANNETQPVKEENAVERRKLVLV